MTVADYSIEVSFHKSPACIVFFKVILLYETLPQNFGA